MAYNRYNQNNMNQGNMNRANSNQKNMESKNSNNSFDNNPKLRDVDPIKLKILTEIKERSKGKSIEELLPEIMKIHQEMNRRNMSFSKTETQILLDAIEESISPEERPKFNMLKGFMNM